MKAAPKAALATHFSNPQLELAISQQLGSGSASLDDFRPFCGQGGPIIPQSGIPGRALRERSGRRQRETARSRRRGGNQRAQGAVRSGAMDQAAFQTRVRVQGRPCRRPVRLFRRARLPSQVEGSTCGTGSSARVQLSTRTDGHGIAHGLPHVCAGAAWLCSVQNVGEV